MGLNPKQKEKYNINSPLYTVLAHLYDHIMRHVDYKRWAEFIIELLTSYGVLPYPHPYHRILEAACGTGSLALYLTRKGYSITGFDRSPEMISQAQSKFKRRNLKGHFEVGDFLSYNPKHNFNALLCLFDSINYLSRKELPQFFRRIHNWLVPPHIFIFDISTPYNSELYFNNQEYSGEFTGWSYTRQMKYYPDDHIQVNRFEVQDLKKGAIYIEEHHQYIYSPQIYRQELQATGWQILEETEDFRRTSPSPTALRIHFVCSSRQ
ncbi:MAG: class I SAM-dependent DNA methyltransferase [bacterium]